MLTAQLVTLLLAVSSTGDTVMLDFRADWCGPCRQMDPVVEQLKAAGYPVRQVNIDQQQDLAAKFRVESVPCFVLLVNGHEVDRTVGATAGATLVGMFRKAGYDPAARPAAAESKRGGTEAPQVFPAELSHAPLVTTSAAKGTVPIFGRRWGSAGVSRKNAVASRTHAAWRLLRSAESDRSQRQFGRLRHDHRRPSGRGLDIDLRAYLSRFGRQRESVRRPLRRGSPQHVPGRLLGCDLERDVALVGITVTGPIAVAHVAPPSYAVHEGDRVIGNRLQQRRRSDRSRKPREFARSVPRPAEH